MCCTTLHTGKQASRQAGLGAVWCGVVWCGVREGQEGGEGLIVIAQGRGVWGGPRGVPARLRRGFLVRDGRTF
jgi:hypothetical protein